MSDTKIKLPRERVLEFRAVNAELQAAQMQVQRAQEAHTKFHAAFTAETTENGSWTVSSLNLDTCECERTLTELGKTRQAEAAKTAAEAAERIAAEKTTVNGAGAPAD